MSMKVEENSAKSVIMEKSLRLFADYGIEGVSVRDIAKESKQNVSQISYYFGSKEGLYQAIIKEHSLLISSKIHKVIQGLSAEDLNEILFEREMKKFISIFVDMRLENPYIAKIMQRETLEGMPFAKEIHNESIKPLVVLLESIMKKAQQKKIIKKKIPIKVFFILLTESIWGFMSKKECKWDLMANTFVFPKDRIKFIQSIYEIFFKGIIV